MNIIEILRAQGLGAPEPVIPGESLKIEPGDRIRCAVPFAEVEAISRRGDELTLVLAGLTAIHLKEFFSTATDAKQPVISFQDQEFTAANLNPLLTVALTVTNAEGIESQLFLLPGSFVNAHSGDVFNVNAQTFQVNDFHREGNHLTMTSHDEDAQIVATVRGFFLKPHDGGEPPKLHVTDPKMGAAQDIIIHPSNPVFQWQGEPLPQAIVGAMYAYYFHLDAKDAENMVLVAKTSEGALPAWLSFASLGGGHYLLSGLPTAEAVGTQDIAIIAQSTAQGVGMHTQQAFNLAVRSDSDWVTRATADDVAAAEFRKAGEIMMADSYTTGLMTVDQMPYMTMPEIAAIVGLAALGQVAFRQPFSSYSTAAEVSTESSFEKNSHLSGSNLLHSTTQGEYIGGAQDFSESTDHNIVTAAMGTEQAGGTLIPGGAEGVAPGAVTPSDAAVSAGSLPMAASVPTSEVGTETFNFEEKLFPGGGESSVVPLTVPEMLYVTPEIKVADDLLAVLSPLAPPASSGSFVPPIIDIHTLSALVDGTHGFALLSTAANSASNYSNPTTVPTGDGFDELLISNGRSFLSPYSVAFTIQGQGAFDASVPFTDASVTLINFDTVSNSFPLAPQVFSIGDFNGDGLNDFLFAGIYDLPSLIVLGQPGPLTSPVTVGPTNSISVSYPSGYSSQAAVLGDVTGDGFSDIIFFNSRSGAGAVVFGSDTDTAGMSINLSTLSGSEGFQILTPGSLNQAIPSVAGANFTGDGMNDIFVSFYNGGIGVILGNTPVFSPYVDITSAGITGADGFIITNNPSPSTYYAIIAPTNIGDFTGSGIDDIAVVSNEAVYVIFGNASFLTATSFNIATMTPSQGIELTSGTTADITSIAYLGDFNGSGLPAFAFIDADANGGLGAIYVIFGSTTFSSEVINYTTLTSNEGFVITDPSINLANASLGSGGDLNGSGLDDLVVTVNGNAYVVFGGNFSGVITQMGDSTPGSIITGIGSNDVIYAGAVDHTIDGGSGNTFIDTGAGTDIINGGAGMNTIVYSSLDTSVNAGSGALDAGPNTLWFETDGNTVNLDNTTIFKGFDEINLLPMQSLTGNQLTINPEGVDNMSHADTLIVEGGGHDSLILDNVGANTWSAGAVVTIAGNSYTTYTSAVTHTVVYAENTLHYVHIV